MESASALSSQVGAARRIPGAGDGCPPQIPAAGAPGPGRRVWVSLSMLGEQPQVRIPPQNPALAHPADLWAEQGVCGHPLRSPPCTFPTPVWGQGLHVHTHTTDSHTRQLEASVLPMKMRSINSHSLAGAEV